MTKPHSQNSNQSQNHPWINTKIRNLTVSSKVWKPCLYTRNILQRLLARFNVTKREKKKGWWKRASPGPESAVEREVRKRRTGLQGYSQRTRMEKAERGHLGQCLSSLQGSYPGYNIRSTPPCNPLCVETLSPNHRASQRRVAYLEKTP